MDTFSARLQALHERVLNPETGKPWMQKAVSEALRERGVEMSPTYFNQLLRGKRQAPSLEILQALASFYGVSLSYFDLTDSQTAESVLQQLDTLQLLQDHRFRRLLTRSHGATDNRQELLAAIVEALEEAERQNGDSASTSGNEQSATD
ncbi:MULTISPECIES: helix-turn-helix domain-containing protein [Dermacoccus]|uniref:XRE family transcriptional regulator n=2 Tax=Dermacoccus TaxID=57495 RepID=A0A417Z0G1_9MICO|nr:helix-turn-helix transcriptional regulator [Dermacoccus abyssi]RHW43744.1 XRE family transcriptional regulator [Dermacoccus abyssi]